MIISDFLYDFSFLFCPFLDVFWYKKRKENNATAIPNDFCKKIGFWSKIVIIIFIITVIIIFIEIA